MINKYRRLVDLVQLVKLVVLAQLVIVMKGSGAGRFMAITIEVGARNSVGPFPQKAVIHEF